MSYPKTPINRKKQFENQYNALKIDKEMLYGDLQNFDKNNDSPLNYIPFPVPNYNYFYQDSFKGLQSFITYKNYNGHTIVFFTAVSPKVSNKQFTNSFEILLSIGFISEFLPQDIFENVKINILSRNHPDYIFSGKIDNKFMKHEFVAFRTFENISFAIVNMKLFDLVNGNLILITPHEKGYFTFNQININKDFSNKENFEDFIDKNIEKWQN